MACAGHSDYKSEVWQNILGYTGILLVLTILLLPLAFNNIAVAIFIFVLLGIVAVFNFLVYSLYRVSTARFRTPYLDWYKKCKDDTKDLPECTKTGKEIKALYEETWGCRRDMTLASLGVAFVTTIIILYFYFTRYNLIKLLDNKTYAR